MRERRTKLYYVDPECLLMFLRSMDQWPLAFTRGIVEGLPEGAELEDVRYDYDRRSLAVLVWHKDFPIVPNGGLTPIAEQGFFEVTQVALMRQSDGSYRSGDDPLCVLPIVCPAPSVATIPEDFTGPVDSRSFEGVQSEAEFFRQSIMAD